MDTFMKTWALITIIIWLPFVLVGALAYCVWWSACAGYAAMEEAMK